MFSFILEINLIVVGFVGNHLHKEAIFLHMCVSTLEIKHITVLRVVNHSR